MIDLLLRHACAVVGCTFVVATVTVTLFDIAEHVLAMRDRGDQ